MSVPISATMADDLVRRLADYLRDAHRNGRIRRDLVLTDDDYADIARISVTELLEDLAAVGVVHVTGEHVGGGPRALRSPGPIKRAFLQGFGESVLPPDPEG